MRGTKTRGNEICFGSYGLQALEPTWITSRQIEASRRAITRYTNVELHYGLEFFLIRR
jgi:large subunit ribosomal protein L16